MPRLSSGFVIAGAYADKIRRTMFAQMRDYVKRDKEWGQRIALAIAQLNRFLYTLLVEQLKIDKGDVVRVRIDYDIDEQNKNIVWKWDTLTVEAFRRVPQEEVEKVVKTLTAKALEISTAAVAYTLEKLGETFDGDIVLAIKLGEREVGAAIITPVNESLAVLKKGAVLEPTPAIFDKVRLDISPDKMLDEVLRETLSKVILSARHVDANEALNTINAIRERVAVKPMAGYEEVEEGTEE
ncbi:MAG: DUF2258 domain-containing protein [Desulfurococcaceae archaeon]|nr:DUF2258 domain-containing protein [Desulfurococcaceae archaeon]MCC6058331.1 DUF2258 domain-containing protein [Desulfurococcaceae archaeon]